MAVSKNKSDLILKSLDDQLLKTGGDPWFNYFDDDYECWTFDDYDYLYDYYYYWCYDTIYNRNRKIEEILGPDTKTTLGDFMK